jgi:hypothetical protein
MEYIVRIAIRSDEPIDEEDRDRIAYRLREHAQQLFEEDGIEVLYASTEEAGENDGAAPDEMSDEDLLS